MFANRVLFIATKHKKEDVLKPVFESVLNVNCCVPENFDSDKLGTFSGEIERQLSPIDAAREKCLLVAKDYNADLILASEGSFFPHPLIGMVSVDEEILMLVDLKNDLEIKIVERSIKTNFNREEVKTVKELLNFATNYNFPTHGLILTGNIRKSKKYFKGMNDTKQLVNCFNALKKMTDHISVETDMRAMYNPTRMEVIKEAAIKLATKVASTCPKCHAPGYGAERLLAGLKCAQCSLPTKSTRSHVYVCRKCGYEKEVEFPNNKKVEDPMYCQFCNP